MTNSDRSSPPPSSIRTSGSTSTSRPTHLLNFEYSTQAFLNNWFAEDYASARQGFLTLCEQRDRAVQTFKHPLTGPNDLAIGTDVALVGDPNAENYVLLVSGTHGVETLVGSGCQVAWLDRYTAEDLPENTAVLLIHAMNPYGAAWRSRYTEDNIDLNRNFVDHRKPYPENPDYATLHQAFSCRSTEGEEKTKAEKSITDFCERHGKPAYVRALCQGQYTHPDGLGFGGQSASWSNRTLHEILAHYSSHAQRIAVIDYHSGIGPYGYGQLINRDPEGSLALARARQWYGQGLVAAEAKTDIHYPVAGGLCSGVAAALPKAQVTGVLLEDGTYDFDQALKAFRSHAPLFEPLQIDKATAEQLRREIQAFFYPACDDWLEMVWSRSEQVIRQTLVGIGGGSS